MAPQPLSAPVVLGEALVDVTRGDIVESVHNVAACAIDRKGDVILSVGEIDVPVYLRSTSKPFIAAAIVREGVATRYGFDPEEVAVIAGSHNGEPFHIEAVRSILRKIGLDESALQCGAHPPYDVESARALERRGIPFSAIHNNCSGKHAGILALCRTLGADIGTYLEPSHPAQRTIANVCARVADLSPENLPFGIDGCGIPVYAIPLRNAALSFARLATLSGMENRDAAALAYVREAMMACPEYVGGTGEFDTAFMQSAPGKIVAKSGAEGVHGVAIVGSGVGLVLKVIDGNARAIPPAALHLLRRLGALDESILDTLHAFEAPTLYNRAGTPVGSIVSR